MLRYNSKQSGESIRRKVLSSGVLGGYTRVYGVYQPPGFFWQRILTSVIINKQGTFRPFATPVCVYPPPFLAIHHWVGAKTRRVHCGRWAGGEACSESFPCFWIKPLQKSLHSNETTWLLTGQESRAIETRPWSLCRCVSWHIAVQNPAFPHLQHATDLYVSDGYDHTRCRHKMGYICRILGCTIPPVVP